VSWAKQSRSQPSPAGPKLLPGATPEPAVLVPDRRLARETVRRIPAADLQGADFWVAA